MSEHHHHAVSGKNLFITIMLNIVITVAQVVGGILSGSLALLSDAMHNFSDVLALVIAYVANRLATRPNDSSRTFGYKRAEILAALFNASVLIAIAIFLIVESVHKFKHPEAIDSTWVIGLGVLSIILNAVSVLLIKDDADGNMNMKAAYLHLLTDVMTSIAVVLGGILMYALGWFWVDPLISMAIALYLVGASFGLVRDSSAILMQFAPSEIELDQVVSRIEQYGEIANVHHIHTWKLDDKQIHFEAHLDFVKDVPLSVSVKTVEKLEQMLHDDFEIEHTTFQCEYNRRDEKSLIK